MRHEPIAVSNPRYPNDKFNPRPEDHFTFGLWTVGNTGRDPFGHAVREVLPPVKNRPRAGQAGRLRRQLARRGSRFPIEATTAERDKIVPRVQGRARRDRNEGPDGDHQPLLAAGLPRGGLHQQRRRQSARSRCRRPCARSIWASISAPAVYVFWGGREGLETNAGKDPRDAVKRFREALNFLCEYVRDNGYNLKFALEAKPNEPRGDIFLPTTGHMLAFIYTLDHHGDGRREPRGRARADAGPRLLARGRPGDRVRQAVPHRSERPEAGPLRSGLPLRQRGSKGRLLPGQAAGGFALGRHAPLRQPRLPHRGRAGRLGLRLLQHAVLHDPQGQGGALPRRRRRSARSWPRRRTATPR